MDNIQVPKALQKEYGNLPVGTKVKLPEMKKRVSHSNIQSMNEAIAMANVNMKSEYFPEHLAFNRFLREGRIDEIVDTKIGKIIKKNEMKKDGEYLKIWWVGFTLPGNKYKDIIETGNVSTSMIFILVPVDTKEDDILKVVIENGKKKEWNGWRFYLQLEGGDFVEIDDKDFSKFHCPCMPRIDGITRNLIEVNRRHIPILPPKIYNTRMKEFMKRNIKEKKVQIFEEPNLGKKFFFVFFCFIQL